MANVTKRKPRAPSATQQAQARGVAERAARIFGTAGAVHSLFDAPRVTGAQLKQAISGMLVRTWNCVPHVIPIMGADGNARGKSSLRVVFTGTGAKASHDWIVSKTKLACHATIILPGCPDDCILPRSLADEWSAYALHELGHMLFTNPAQWRYTLKSLAVKHALPAATVHSYLNGLEDVRQERALLSAGYAAGFGGVVKGLLSRIVQDQAIDAVLSLRAGKPAAFPFALAYGLRGYAAGADAIVAAVPADLREVYDYAGRELANLPPVDATNYADGTARVADIVDSVLTRLREIYKDTGASNEPGEGEPGEGEPGEGEPGEGEPGEGEPGEGEPGEGGSTSGGYSPDQPSADQPDAPQPSARNKSDLESPADDTAPVPVGLPENVRADVTGSILPPDVTTINAQLSQDQADDWARQQLNKVTRAGALRAALRRLFTRTDVNSFEGGRRSGRLRVASLARVATGAENVFEKRTLKDGFDSAVSIVIDQSSSMYGQINDAAGVAFTLADLLSQAAGVKVEICGFQTCNAAQEEESIKRAILSEADGSYDPWSAKAPAKNADDEYDENADGADDYFTIAAIGKCRLNVFKEYATPIGKARGRIASAWASGGTPDLEALVSAGRRLLAQPAGRRVLIMVTDGQGDDKTLIRKACEGMERAGVIILSLGIGFQPEGYRHSVQVDSAAGLSGKGLDALLRLIEREQAARDGAE